MNSDTYATPVLAWYDAHRRRLPWRAEPGQAVDPYVVWLSEIMLQQTTVATVQPRFAAFLARWSTVSDLAAASLDQVLVEWQGLGYYARARNLHRCAEVVHNEYGGRFPMEVDQLRQLPGIGAYTAKAIAAIAFNQPVLPVDTNVERIVARLFAIDAPLPGGKALIAARAAGLADPHRPGDFAQALMDLGASTCRPRQPACHNCPLEVVCQAAAVGPELFPVRAAKRPRPLRTGTVFWLENPHGEVLLRRRPDSGLLGGMTEFPSTAWEERANASVEQLASAAPLPSEWTATAGQVDHTFTHFQLTLRVVRGVSQADPPADAFWVHPDAFADHALPTVMKKVARHVLAQP